MAIKELLLNFDKTVFFYFQNLQSPKLYYFLAWPTRFGETLLAETILVFGILIFDKAKRLEKIAVSSAGILITHWASIYLKALFHRPRPFQIWPQIHVIYGKPFNGALPSGHTSIAFAAAFLADYLYPGKMRWTYAVAAWIGITRIYIGVHYPTDILAGAVTGIACAALTCKLIWRHNT